MNDSQKKFRIEKKIEVQGTGFSIRKDRSGTYRKIKFSTGTYRKMKFIFVYL